ncbi:glycosyltransferase family 4 protein, partial [Staphylococcus pseudintermedius]|nr:glycosyltransferase family 4 protein [Staphylococcus pseudintermedius]
KLNRWYRSLDIYIQPSKTEGHGRAVVEAISNGVPVLASNKGGLPDSVHRDFLFDSRNESALAFAVKKLINNEGLREININENIAKIKKYKKRVVQQKRIEALDSYRSLILEEEK